MSAATPAYLHTHRLQSGRLSLLLTNVVTSVAMKLARLHFDPVVERKRLAKADALLFKPDPRLKRETTRLTGDGRTVETIHLSMPQVTPGRVILYLHGGAFIFRIPNAHAAMLAHWCEALQAVAWLPQYGLAPENPYPAGIDDCFAAWRALRAQGVAAKDIVIAGDSAGGNLTLALLHRLKAAGEPMPACAVMLSPVVDLTINSESLVKNERSDPMFDLPTLIAFRSAYVKPEQCFNPDASPLFADMAGYPPLLFHASTSEMLRDESVRAAAKAHAAGVTVRLDLWEKMPHVFQALPALPQAALAIANIIEFIREHANWR